MDSRKGSFAEFFKERRGSDIYDMVLEKSNNISIAKEIRRDLAPITAYYRDQYNQMLRARAGGFTGWLDFQEW